MIRSATTLPVELNTVDNNIFELRSGATICKVQNRKDATYIELAMNEFPNLVRELKFMYEDYCSGGAENKIVRDLLIRCGVKI